METKRLLKPRHSLARLATRLVHRQRIRKDLRKPSGFRFAIGDSIGFMDAEKWDRVVGGSTFFLSRGYLRMLEQAGPGNISARYVIVFDGDVPVAAVYLQIATVSGSRFGAPKEAAPTRNPLRLVRGAFAPAARRLKSGLRERVLVCGNLLSYGFHGVAFAPDVDRKRLWPAIAEAIYRIRRGEKLSGQTDFILIKDITPQESEDVAVLADLSYRPLETEPNMMLDLPSEWKTYDHYLNSLQSKYRSSVRQQILKPIDAAGCIVEHVSGLADHAERLHELYMAVHEKAAVRPFTLPHDYFPALEATAGDRMLCTVIRHEEHIVGFIITLKDDETGYGYHIGFDRAAGESLPLYLRLLHASIADALELGCRKLSFGRTALEPKARLGAQPQPITVWMRHRQPIMNLFVRNLLRVIPHEDAPERNPFKKAEGKGADAAEA
jgi:predicted N-acyltransferase